jgi:hypothetical protein
MKYARAAYKERYTNFLPKFIAAPRHPWRVEILKNEEPRSKLLGIFVG